MLTMVFLDESDGVSIMYRARIVGTRFKQVCELGGIGHVHSVFDRAVNIEMKESKKCFLTILKDKVDMMSSNLVLDSNTTSMRQIMVQNDKVFFTSDCIYVNGRIVVFDVSKALVWEKVTSSNFSKQSNFKGYDELLRACMFARKVLSNRNVQSIKFPEENLEDFDPLSILGLGYGLTPSGDDFIAGLLHGIHFMEMLFNEDVPFKKRLTQIVAENLHKTVSISQHFLRHALLKEWGQNTEIFLIALINNNQEDLKDSIRQKMNVGASSGYDELQGCLYGVEQLSRYFMGLNFTNL